LFLSFVVNRTPEISKLGFRNEKASQVDEAIQSLKRLRWR